jgi:hypothetical protein
MDIQIKKIRKINSLVLAFCFFYLIQNYTIGQLKIEFNEILVWRIYLKEITFIITSYLLCRLIFD